MKHIRDPVTGRCAVCESNGLDPSVLHNGIFYPDTGKSKPPQAQVIEVREDYRPSPRPERQAPSYSEAKPPGKPSSVTAQSVGSTASASHITFANQRHFYDDLTPPPSPPIREQPPRRQYNDGSPRYSPEGSPSRARYSDSKFREPQVWFVGEGPERPARDRSPSFTRREKRRSPSPDRRRQRRERTPSPDDRWRRDRQSYNRESKRDNQYYNKRSYDRQPVKSKKNYGLSSQGGRSRACRRCCTCRRCCMVFWITLLILLALGALATAIYFAVTGAQNESSVQDITLIEDPRYVILGLDQPCRTTSATTTTTAKPTTTDPKATTTTTTTAIPTTTLILCNDITTTVVRSGSEFRNAAAPHFTLPFSLYLAVAVTWLCRNLLKRNFYMDI